MNKRIERNRTEVEEAKSRLSVWWKQFDRIAVVTSFQSTGLVVIHMLLELGMAPEVLFLDTGFHFRESLAFRDEITQRWGIKATTLRGKHGSVEEQDRRYGGRLYRKDPALCCHINKVEPLLGALENYDAWVAGIRRDQSLGRANADPSEPYPLPSGRSIVKLHPLIDWTQQQVDRYLAEHDINPHPLLEAGFASIGCWPCTRPVGAGENPRAGRWPGLLRTECGLHTLGKTRPTDSPHVC